MADDLDMYLEGDDDMMGARRRRRRGRRGRGRSVRARLLRGSRAGGAQTAALGKYNLGLPVQTFTMAAQGPFVAQANPQKPFKPMRLVVVVTRTPLGVGGLISINAASVGVDPVLVSTDPIPAEAFSPEASNGMDNIAWPEASKGLLVSIQYANSVAVGAGESVTIGTALWGPTAT